MAGIKKDRDPILMVCAVVLVATLICVSGSAIYDDYIKADNTVAVEGDKVTVNYTGTYYSPFGEEYAVVFDSNLWSVVDSNIYAKSNDFTEKSRSDCVGLTFTIGSGEVLDGFGNAAIGLKVGEKTNIRIPAGEGYNSADTLVSMNTAENSSPSDFKIKSTETLTMKQFEDLYDLKPVGPGTLEVSCYGWPASYAFNSSENTVTLSYLVEAGKTYDLPDNEFGKVGLEVVSTGSEISCNYVISEYKLTGNEYSIEDSKDKEEVQMIKVDFGTSSLYIMAVTITDDKVTSFTYKTVEEKYNEDLYFEIEITSIGE